MKNSSRFTDWILLLAVPAFFFLWKLAAFGLIGADEPRYAQVAREMLARHDWITPTLGGIPWLEKPPLYYWQAMIAYRLFGVSDWAARLPSVFDAFLMVLAVYWLSAALPAGVATRWRADTRNVSGHCRIRSRRFDRHAVDGNLHYRDVGVVRVVRERRKKISGELLWIFRFGDAGQGPGRAISCRGDDRNFCRAAEKRKDCAKDALDSRDIALAARSPCPGMCWCSCAIRSSFMNSSWSTIWRASESNLYHHPEPFWYYVPVTLLGWVPWSIIAIAALVARIAAVTQYQPADTSALVSADLDRLVVIFFSISQSKLPGYVLPAIPAGAILATRFIFAQSSERITTWLRFRSCGRARSAVRRAGFRGPGRSIPGA